MSLVTCRSCGQLVKAAWLPEYLRGYAPQRPARHMTRPGVPCLPKSARTLADEVAAGLHDRPHP